MVHLAAPHRVSAGSWVEAGDLRFAGLLLGGLAVLGVLTGLLWSAISPHSHGFVVPGLGVIPGEAEGFVAADGRYALLTGGIGLLTGLLVWFRRDRRGPVTAAAVSAGVLLASALAALVGHAVSSGRSTGPANTSVTLPITVHAHGLIPLGAALALLVYLAGALSARPDDLGRPDQGNAALVAGPASFASEPGTASQPGTGSYSGTGSHPEIGSQPDGGAWSPPPAAPSDWSPPTSSC